jgi:hypothetical protein
VHLLLLCIYPATTHHQVIPLLLHTAAAAALPVVLLLTGARSSTSLPAVSLIGDFAYTCIRFATNIAPSKMLCPLLHA